MGITLWRRMQCGHHSARRKPLRKNPPTHQPNFVFASQLGTHLRGKRKREELANYMRKQQKKEAAEHKAAGHK